MRLAVVVSHPIQYYAPLYQRLARRDDVQLKVFFTWHDGSQPVQDGGFRKAISWDIPVAEGYEFELVPNVSTDPGTHRFLGLKNPSLVERVVAWKPDAVQITGWAWHSHLLAMRSLSKRGIPTIFRGDSHLLDSAQRGIRWRLKHAVLARVFSWPAACLYVGKANRAYYEAFGVEASRLFPCPHSIDVARFGQPAQELELEANRWREQLGIGADKIVLLFAGKFEPKKRPVQLMRAIQSMDDPRFVMVMLGGGVQCNEVEAIASADPERFRVIAFQNQSRMPVAYRLGDLLILPSAFGETWGLAINEAMACSRPALASDRVGCAADMIDDSCGRVFPWNDFPAMARALGEMCTDRKALSQMGLAALQRAREFDIGATESSLLECVSRVIGK